MSGWQWCSRARGRCRVCGSFVTGLWRYWSPTVLATSEADVCGCCAEGLDKPEPLC